MSPYSVSIELKFCQKCKFSNKRKFISVNVDVLLKKGLYHIRDGIDDANVVKNSCIKCNNSCDIIENYGIQVMIDTTILTDPNYIENIGVKQRIYNLDNISKEIMVQHKRYVLR